MVFFEQTKITTVFANGEISMKDFVEEIHRCNGEVNFSQLTEIENEALRLGMRRLYEIGFRAKQSGRNLIIVNMKSSIALYLLPSIVC